MRWIALIVLLAGCSVSKQVIRVEVKPHIQDWTISVQLEAE